MSVYNKDFFKLYNNWEYSVFNDYVQKIEKSFKNLI